MAEVKKVDFKKEMKEYFLAPKDSFRRLTVPEMLFVKVDGEGDPNTSATYGDALQWLYSASYKIKFASKTKLARDYVVPPLQGLWWADDPSAFVTRAKDKWLWTMMLMVPAFITRQIYDDAVQQAGKKLGTPPQSLRLEKLDEGDCLQALHVGSYDDEGPLLAKLHDEVMPQMNLTFNGPHHEIYLGDPRRVAPEKLRTILRQPVKPLR